jgi:hypothetical protein
MRRLLNVAHYSRIIAKETGRPRWKVHLVLMFAWTNIMRMISRGEEVKLTGFGRIYFLKEPLKDEQPVNAEALDAHRRQLLELAQRIEPRKVSGSDFIDD